MSPQYGRITQSQLIPGRMKQVEYNFDTVSNFKEFFITEDGISNSGYETFISVFRRYTCHAGCDVCYIADRWVGPDGTDYFTKYVPDSITDVMEQRILDAFSHFTIVSTIDDLRYVKTQHPQLFEFYKRHSDKMNLTSMTDMSFLQQTPIALNDLNFISIYDITFSDYFLQKPKVCKAVLENLEALNDRYPLVKLRFIFSTDPTVDRSGIKRVISWAKDRGIYTSGTLDNRGTWFVNHNLMDLMDNKETCYMVDNNELHQIYTEVVHLMFDRWVVSFYQSTQDEDVSFYQLTDKFRPDDWLEAHVRLKIRLYSESARTIVRTDKNASYCDYFDYVANNVRVNDNWNFIPTIMMNKRSNNMHQGLLRCGFVETPLGIVRSSALQNREQIIPLYSFK